jgi:rubredoxin
MPARASFKCFVFTTRNLPQDETGLDADSITAKKQAEAERLRAAERFMVVGGGNGTCQSCGYKYTSDKGDPDFPVARGTKFEVRLWLLLLPMCLGFCRWIALSAWATWSVTCWKLP